MPKTKIPRKSQNSAHSLVAEIETNNFSYFIKSHELVQGKRIDDEAIIELNARILKIEPFQPNHLGQRIGCSLICSRSFHQDSSGERPNEHVFLCTINLRKDGRSMLAYLPADAFWGLKATLDVRALKYFEASYEKPLRGSSELISLHFS
jgi:hypothetical protein